MSIPAHDPNGGVLGTIAAHSPMLFTVNGVADGELMPGQPVSIVSHGVFKKSVDEKIVGFALASHTEDGKTKSGETCQILLSGVFWAEIDCVKVDMSTPVRIMLDSGKFTDSAVQDRSAQVVGALYLDNTRGIAQVMVPSGWTLKKD